METIKWLGVITLHACCVRVRKLSQLYRVRLLNGRNPLHFLTRRIYNGRTCYFLSAIRAFNGRKRAIMPAKDAGAMGGACRNINASASALGGTLSQFNGTASALGG